MAQERGPALVAQQIGGYQGGGDPAGPFKPGAAHAEAADEVLLGLGGYGEKRDEVEHSLSFQVEAHDGPRAWWGARRRMPG